MDNYEFIRLLHQGLLNVGNDIKLEPQLALAAEKGLTPDDFMVSPDNIFTREFSKDIVGIEIREDARKDEYLLLHLSRAGIYDQLPEGLFYQQAQHRANKFAADMAADYKMNKKREEELRRFFLPFDNDFFWQRLQLEQEENRLLEGLQSGIINDYFVRFWGISRAMPQIFITPLILLLPYAHQVAGDLHLTAECLEQLLLEQVVINQKRSTVSKSPAGLSQSLGETLLGVDMLCGESFIEDCPVFEIVIGPLQRSGITDYLEGGNRFELLETFSRFFVPAGVDIEFVIRVPEAKQIMVLEEDGPVLGYSSILI